VGEVREGHWEEVDLDLDLFRVKGEIKEEGLMRESFGPPCKVYQLMM